MKKLLTLMLVLGLVSAANAATVDIVVSVGGNPYAGEMLALGTVVNVEIVQSATDTFNGGGQLSVDLDGANPTINDTTPSPNYGQGQFHGWGWLLNTGVWLTDNGGGSYTASKGAAGNVGVGTPGIGASMNILDPFDLYVSTYEFAFDATVTTLLDWGSATDWDLTGGNITLGPPVLVNVVPEPMTIALLGLGGLFLRRRR